MSKEAERIEPHGFIEVELVNSITKERRTYRNTITQAGKMLILDKSAARFLLSGADSFGYMAQVGRLAKILGTGDSNKGYAAGRDARGDSMLTCALLNMEAAGANWNELTNGVNLFGQSLDDSSQVVGYANNNPTPAVGGNEGSVDYCLGVYQTDGKTVAERWKFPEGVASGTINMVAMLPADSIKTNHGEGWGVCKCIDKCHIQSPNFGSLSTGFLPPGIEGYTTSEEVLLNFIMDGGSRWKYNITTGEVTDVPDSEPFFVIEQADRVTFDIYKDENYLYVITPYSTAFPVTTSTLAVVTVYDVNKQMAQVSKFNLSRKVSGESRTGFKFFRVGDDLYVSTWSSNQIATLPTWCSAWKIVKGSRGFGTSATQVINYIDAGISLPAGLDEGHTGIGTAPNGRIWLYVSSDPEYADTTTKVADNGFTSIGFQTNQDYNGDLSNLTLSGSMVFGLTPNTWFNGVNLLKIGVNYCSKLTGDNLGQVGDNTDISSQIVNTSGTEAVDYKTSGCFISRPEWTGNLFSFVYLPTPIEKVEADILYVTYGYKIV